MDIEVEYDLNPTDLYNHICNSDWESALYSIDANPIEAKIWVVKREVGDFADGEIACRFLPLHSACARRPPYPLISSLLKSYPEGAAIRDDNGMYPLHYACANQAAPEVIHLLLSSYPDANFFRIETTGNLPVHLVAQWGASSVSVIDILLEHSISLACAKDFQDKTPLEVAAAADDYEYKEEIVRRLEAAAEEADMDASTSSTITTNTWASSHKDKRIDSKETETIVQGTSVQHSTTKSVTRMRAEIMALRAQREFIRAEADEQIAHEWKEIRNMISNLSKADHSQSECQSSCAKTQKRSICDGKDYTSLNSEQEAQLDNINEENVWLKVEYDRTKKECDVYYAKIDALCKTLNELYQHTKMLVREQNTSHERVNQMESNMQVLSAWRQTRLQRMLKEEKSYYAQVTDQISSAYRSEKTEKVVGKEMEMLGEYESILQEIDEMTK